jgi:hypothetical protein
MAIHEGQTRLFTIDSRDREPGAAGIQDITLKIEGGITFNKISLIFADIPNDVADTESLYFITIRELGTGVRGTRYNDNASFIQCKMAGLDQRSFAFENLSYSQTIDLGQNKTFTEFNVQLRYRADAAAPLEMVSDYSLIFRIHTD